MDRFEELNNFVDTAKKFTLRQAQENDEEEYLKRKRVNDVRSKTKKYKEAQLKWEKTEAARAQRKLRGSLSYSGKIKEFYKNRPKGCHVDHIIPLRFGGKHILENLQYLPGVSNLRKTKNKITTEMKVQLMRNRFIRKL